MHGASASVSVVEGSAPNVAVADDAPANPARLKRARKQSAKAAAGGDDAKATGAASTDKARPSCVPRQLDEDLAEGVESMDVSRAAPLESDMLSGTCSGHVGAEKA